MNEHELREAFGPDYPDAILLEGLRLPLVAERLWSRAYCDPEHRMAATLSRFLDSSATLTLPDLRGEWATSSEQDRVDLCLGIGFLNEQADFHEMLRFIIANATERELSCIASCASAFLPQAEAFNVFSAALDAAAIGEGANFAQALAITRDPRAESALRARLQMAWSHASLWKDDPFTNWFAFEATVCIQHLLEIGASPGDFEAQVRALAQHPCRGTQSTCAGYLKSFYPWLPEAERPAGGA